MLALPLAKNGLYLLMLRVLNNYTDILLLSKRKTCDNVVRAAYTNNNWRSYPEYKAVTAGYIGHRNRFGIRESQYQQNVYTKGIS